MESPCIKSGGLALRNRLAMPTRQISLAEAADTWHHARIDVCCKGAGDMAADPRIAARIRGALGRRLGEAASAETLSGAPCPWSPPCTLDWLFGKHGRICGGLEIPKPYVVAVQAEGEDLIVTLTLFGFATDLAETVADALVRALRTGLNEGAVDRVRYRPMEIGNRSLTVFDAVQVPTAPDQSTMMVSMRTPLSIRDGDRIKTPNFGDLVSAATHRVQGMARWQDAALQADWPALINEGRSLARQNVTEPRITHWQRGSTRQDRRFTVGGGFGQWLVDTPSADLLHLLTLATTTGAGGRTSLGMGQFDIKTLPA